MALRPIPLTKPVARLITATQKAPVYTGTTYSLLIFQFPQYQPATSRYYNNIATFEQNILIEPLTFFYFGILERQCHLYTVLPA